MRREIHYHWRIREHMARAGMKNSRDLVGPLRERGITLSESQWPDPGSLIQGV
jgi:hypothetical protein